MWYLIRLAALGLLGSLLWSRAPQDPMGPTLLIGATGAWAAVSTTQSHGAIRGAAVGLTLMAAWAWICAGVMWRTAGINGALSAESWLGTMVVLDALALVFAVVARQRRQELR